MRQGPMQTYVVNILEAGLAPSDFAQLLVDLRCLSGLRALYAVHPALDLGRMALESIAEAGWLEAVEWCLQLGSDTGRRCCSMCTGSCQDRQMGHPRRSPAAASLC